MFTALRDLLRLRHDELRGRPPDEPLTAASSAGESGRIDGRHCPEAIVLDYLDRYWDHLFGHPLARDSEGRVVAVVERTNDPAEHFFSQLEFAKRLVRDGLAAP